jgi:hypothetical protein
MPTIATARGAFTSAIIATLALAMPAMALEAKVSSPAKIVVAFQEESIPGADMPTPTPTALPAGGASPGASPVAGVSPGTGSPAAGAASPAQGTAAAEQSSTSGESPAAASSSAAEASPAPTPTDIPPAMDIGSVAPTLRVSDSSLAGLIAGAQDPARNASLRITEAARKEMVSGQLESAIRDLGRALSIDPNNPYAYVYLGRAYILKKNYAQAQTFLQHAEVGFGTDPVWQGETLAFEGVAYEEAGQQALAAATYQKALAVTPGNLTARVGATRLSEFLPAAAPAGAPTPEGGALEPAPSTGPAPGAPPEAEPPPPPPPASEDSPSN